MNHDGRVDVRDLIAVARHLGSHKAKYDVNGDGRVDLRDLRIVLDCIVHHDEHHGHHDHDGHDDHHD